MLMMSKIEMRVKKLNDDRTVLMEVIVGGILSSRKGMNLPETKISIPAITEKDKRDIEFMAKECLDWWRYLLCVNQKM